VYLAKGEKMVLKYMRKKSNAKKIWIILAILILPAFLFWGFGSFVRSRGYGAKKTTFAGKIFGKNVPFSDYAYSYKAIVSQNILRWGEEKFRALANLIDLRQEAWNRLILLYEAKRQKIRVSDKELAQFIESNPLFKRNGCFDLKTYKEILEYALHLPVRTYEEQMRQTLMLVKLYENITAKVNLTEAQIEQAYKKENEEVSIEYIAADFSALSQKIKISDEEILKFWQEHKNEFALPLALNVDYLKTDFPGQDTREKDFEEKINKIGLSLSAGKTLEEIANDFALKIYSSGIFAGNAPIPGLAQTQDLNQLITQLKEGQTSNLIYLKDACYIFKLKEKKTNYLPELTQIKDKVKDKLLLMKTIEEAKEKITRAYKELEKTPSLSKVAKELNLTYASTDFFKRNAQSKEIGSLTELYDAAQKLKTNQISPPIETARGLFIIKLKELRPIDKEKFMQEKADFAQKLLEEEKEKAFASFLKQLKAKAALEDYTANLNF